LTQPGVLSLEVENHADAGQVGAYVENFLCLALASVCAWCYKKSIAAATDPVGQWHCQQHQ